MKIKLTLFLLAVVCFLSSPFSVFADPAGGINVINDPSSAANMPDPNFQNWIVYAPDSPESLATANISANNVVIRIHSSWTDTGRNMLGSPGEQQQAADSWAAAIKEFAASGKTVYIEPFNELEQNYERNSPTGILNITDGISRALNFIQLLQSQVGNSAIITSPAFDPLNPNFPLTYAAFKNISNIISYHAYSLEAIAKLSQLFPGKQFLLTEIGAIKNGQVTYNDQDLINFFCSDGMAAAIKSTPGLMAYFMFSFAPGDASSSWSFTNGNVAKAIQGRCNEINLTATPYPTRIPTPGVPGLPQHTSNDWIPPGVSTKFVQIPHLVNQGWGDPNAANGPTDYTCTTQATVKETKNVNTKTITDDQGQTHTEDQPTLVTSITGQVDVNQPYTNYGLSTHEMYADYTPQTFIRKKLLKPIDWLYHFFLSYKDDGANAAVRSLTLDEKRVLRWHYLKDAVLSLEKDPTKKVETVVSDEPIAWACPHVFYHCMDILEAHDSSCRPLTLAELVYGLSYRGLAIAYEWDTASDGHKIAKQVSVPGDLKAILTKYFEQGGYEETYGIPFEQAIGACYSHLRDNLDRLMPWGSIKNQIIVYNVNALGVAETTVTNRAIPNGAAMAHENTSYFLDHTRFARQSVKSTGSICDTGGGTTTIHQPTPISFLGWVKNLFITIFHTATLTQTVQVDNKLPSGFNTNLKKSDQMFADLTYKQDQSKLKKDAKSSPGGNGQLPLQEPGESYVSQYNSIFNKELHFRNSAAVFVASYNSTFSPNSTAISGPVSSYCSGINSAASANGLDPSLIAAIISVESQGNPNAISSQGAVGLMQVMPSDGPAAAFICNGSPCFAARPTTQQLLNPDFNINYGSQLVAGFISAYGSPRDGLMHYGPTGMGYAYADQVLGVYNGNKNVCSGTPASGTSL